jgi:hypothetical protein
MDMFQHELDEVYQSGQLLHIAKIDSPLTMQLAVTFTLPKLRSPIFVDLSRSELKDNAKAGGVHDHFRTDIV